jgi:hypothetical protein
MLQDIVRGTLQTIFRDKILLGLLIIGVISMVSFGATKDDKKPHDEQPMNGQQAQAQAQAQGQGQPAQQQSQQQSAAQAQAAQIEEAKLASEFVHWWITGAMDYSQATCQKNHVDAFKWMNPEAIEVFRANFWTPEMEQAFATGTLVASFQPSAIEAKAINPDGSVVVRVDGTLVMQMGGQPTTQRVQTDYLVKKDKGSLRIAALHARTIAPFATMPTY